MFVGLVVVVSVAVVVVVAVAVTVGRPFYKTIQLALGDPAHQDTTQLGGEAEESSIMKFLFPLHPICCQ